MPTTPRQIDAAQLEGQMLQIVRELLTELGSVRAAESVTLGSSLQRDLGLGSLEMVELLVRTEAHFNVRLPDRIAEEADTPADWVRAVAGGDEEAPAASQRYTITQPARVAPPPPESARSTSRRQSARVLRSACPSPMVPWGPQASALDRGRWRRHAFASNGPNSMQPWREETWTG